MAAEAATPNSANEVGSGTEAPRRAQSSGVTSGPAALRELLGGKAGKSEIRMSNLETNSNDRSAENGESARRAGARKAA